MIRWVVDLTDRLDFPVVGSCHVTHSFHSRFLFSRTPVCLVQQVLGGTKLSEDFRSALDRNMSYYRLKAKSERAGEVFLPLSIQEVPVNHAVVASWLPTTTRLSDEEWFLVLKRVLPLLELESQAESRALVRLGERVDAARWACAHMAQMTSVAMAAVAAVALALADSDDDEGGGGGGDVDHGVLAEPLAAATAEYRRLVDLKAQAEEAASRTKLTWSMLDFMVGCEIRDPQALDGVDREYYEELFGQ
jgi:hypothetical protein